jgi:hypothetical protein
MSLIRFLASPTLDMVSPFGKARSTSAIIMLMKIPNDKLSNADPRKRNALTAFSPYPADLVARNSDIGIALMYHEACLMESLDWPRGSARN